MRVDEIPFLEIAPSGRMFKPDEEFKSELVIGNVTVRFTKSFNWFNRLMLKLVFGLNIHNI